MSNRLLVSDLQNSRIPAVLGVCPTDDRFYAWLNEADSRLLDAGRWWGSVREAQFCVDGTGVLVFPREVAVVEKLSICGANAIMENPWFQFTNTLASTSLPCSSCASASASGNAYCGACGGLTFRERREEWCSFSQTVERGSVFRFYPTSADDVGKKLTVQGYDSNNIYARGIVDGALGNGEQVTLALPFVETVTQWAPGQPLGVIKEVTTQRVLAYEVLADDTERAIADYEPGETRPSYRVGVVPFMQKIRCCESSDSENVDGDRRTLTAMVSLRHTDVSSPGDWLILQNLSAYKAAMMAVKAWEDGDIGKGNYYFYGAEAASKNARGPLRVVNRGGAIPMLQAELRKNTGDRVNAFIQPDPTQKRTRQMAGFW